MALHSLDYEDQKRLGQADFPRCPECDRQMVEEIEEGQALYTRMRDNFRAIKTGYLRCCDKRCHGRVKKP